jgi:hypothetical protein
LVQNRKKNIDDKVQKLNCYGHSMFCWQALYKWLNPANASTCMQLQMRYSPQFLVSLKTTSAQSFIQLNGQVEQKVTRVAWVPSISSSSQIRDNYHEVDMQDQSLYHMYEETGCLMKAHFWHKSLANPDQHPQTKKHKKDASGPKIALGILTSKKHIVSPTYGRWCWCKECFNACWIRLVMIKCWIWMKFISWLRQIYTSHTKQSPQWAPKAMVESNVTDI